MIKFYGIRYVLILFIGAACGSCEDRVPSRQLSTQQPPAVATAGTFGESPVIWGRFPEPHENVDGTVALFTLYSQLPRELEDTSITPVHRALGIAAARAICEAVRFDVRIDAYTNIICDSGTMPSSEAMKAVSVVRTAGIMAASEGRDHDAQICERALLWLSFRFANVPTEPRLTRFRWLLSESCGRSAVEVRLARDPQAVLATESVSTEMLSDRMSKTKLAIPAAGK